jgi:hypothetical protein
LGDAREILRAVKRARAIGLRLVLVEIIDDDEVEIGRRRHLASAELAERQNRALLRAQPSVRHLEIIRDGTLDRAHDHVGKAREGLSGLLGRDRAGQDARADQEHVLLAELAGAIEQILIAAGLRERSRQLGAKLLGIRQRAEERGLDQRVHDLGMLRQDIGEPRRGAEREREQRHQVRVAPQQREQARSAMQAGEKPVERHQRAVGIFRPRQMIDQHRNEFGEMRTRELASERAVGSGEPAAHRVADFERTVEAHRGELVQRRGVVFFRREGERAA